MNSAILNSILNSIKFINEKILTLSNKIYDITTNLQNNYVTNTYLSDNYVLKTNAPIICKLVNNINNINNTYIIQENLLSIIYLIGGISNFRPEKLDSNNFDISKYIFNTDIQYPISQIYISLRITIPIGKLVKIYAITFSEVGNDMNYMIDLIYILDNKNSNDVPLNNSTTFNNGYLDVNLEILESFISYSKPILGIIVCGGFTDEINNLQNSYSYLDAM